MAFFSHICINLLKIHLYKRSSFSPTAHPVLTGGGEGISRISPMTWRSWRWVTHDNMTTSKRFTYYWLFMRRSTLASWLGNTFRITRPLWGESADHRPVDPVTPHKGASDAEVWFLWLAWTRCWINNRVTGDLICMTLMWHRSGIWNITRNANEMFYVNKVHFRGRGYCAITKPRVMLWCEFCANGDYKVYPMMTFEFPWQYKTAFE